MEQFAVVRRTSRRCSCVPLGVAPQPLLGVPLGHEQRARPQLDGRRFLLRGQERAYYWRHDGLTLMGACDLDRAAELEPQTVRLMDLPTYEVYGASRLTSNKGC